MMANEYMYRNSSNKLDVLFERGRQKLSLNYIIHQYWEEEGDQRTKFYPLFGDGPTKMLAIMASYLLFVKVIGMKIFSSNYFIEFHS
jgi:hypothetical protein